MMKIDVKDADLVACIDEAQRERIVLTCRGKPVALVVGVKGMDEEQVELGGSDKFWNLVTKRRKQRTVNRARLEQKLRNTK